MTYLNDRIQEQIEYYRARASEYDDWFYRRGRYDHGRVLNRQWFDEASIVMQALRSIGPLGHILELACGTGIWTKELLQIGESITAIDASPEMLEINKRKVHSPKVNYLQSDLFLWEPDREYELVIFAFWISHVPPDYLENFLHKVRRALSAKGQIFIVDSQMERTSTAKDNLLQENEHLYQTRRLKDGKQFNVMKVFYEPEDLQRKLLHAGIEANVRSTDRYFIYSVGMKR